MSDQQAARTPNVSDSPDMQYGDRKMLEEGQRSVPIARSREPKPGPRETAAAGTRRIPNRAFDRKSARPDEPLSEGMPGFAGAGREVLQTGMTDEDDIIGSYLMHLARNYHSRVALETVGEMRTARAQVQPVPMQAPMQSVQPMAPAQEEETDLALFDEDEEPVEEEAPVDEPAEPDVVV